MHYVPPFLLSLAFRRTEAAAALRTSERLTHDFGTRVIHERLEAEHEGLEVAQNLFSTFSNLFLFLSWRRKLTARNIQCSSTLRRRENSSSIVMRSSHRRLFFCWADKTQPYAIHFPIKLQPSSDSGKANTLAFGLRELAKHPDVQDQLRAEIHSSLGSNSGIVYDNLPLLNAFIKVCIDRIVNYCRRKLRPCRLQETLRMYPAEPISETMALEDTILPLTYGLATTSGEHITKLPIRKGELVLMALGSYQRSGYIYYSPLQMTVSTDLSQFGVRTRTNLSRPDGLRALRMFFILGPTQICASVFGHAYILTSIFRLSFYAGPRTCLGYVQRCIWPCIIHPFPLTDGVLRTLVIIIFNSFSHMQSTQSHGDAGPDLRAAEQVFVRPARE